MSAQDAKQTYVISGVGPYSNPLEIYNPGHRLYTENSTSSDTNKIGIHSGMITNINLLDSELDNIPVDNSDCFLLNKSRLSTNFTIPPEYSGYSTDLDFKEFNVITTTNEYVNI